MRIPASELGAVLHGMLLEPPSPGTLRRRAGGRRDGGKKDAGGRTRGTQARRRTSASREACRTACPVSATPASAPTPREAHVTPDDEITVLGAQVRKTVALLKQREPLSEADANELRNCLAMFEGHSTEGRGRGNITNEEAAELATVMVEFRGAAVAHGVEMPAFEESSTVEAEPENAPKPT